MIILIGLKENEMSQFNMTIEELKQLKVDDEVVVQGKIRTVTKVGRKWISLSHNLNPINLETGKLKSTGYGCGGEFKIYKDPRSYQNELDHIKKVNDVRTCVQNLHFPYHVWYPTQKLTDEFIDDLQDLLVKYGLMEI